MRLINMRERRALSFLASQSQRPQSTGATSHIFYRSASHFHDKSDRALPRISAPRARARRRSESQCCFLFAPLIGACYQLSPFLATIEVTPRRRRRRRRRRRCRRRSFAARARVASRVLRND